MIHVMVLSETVAALPKRTWESLIGAGLASYQKLGFSQNTGHDELPVDRIMYFAKKYKSSIHILSAVADFLDSLDAYVNLITVSNLIAWRSL